MIVEEQLLPSPQLKPAYEDVVWCYVFRDFSGSERDRAAERIQLRFGVTSYPQIFLAHPASFAILAHTGRQVDSFMTAVGSVQVEKPTDKSALERTVQAERLAARLEGRRGNALAAKCLDHEDIVVRTRALALVAKKNPKLVVGRAEELLAVPSDPFRYQVCEVLGKAGHAAAAPALEALLAEPKDSLNPNVLRIRAVQALASCGSASSVPVIAPHAQSGEYFNGLTGTAVDTLAAIARRDRSARAPVQTTLKAAYPPPAPSGDQRSQRACLALARRVHKALGARRPFPKDYNEQTRAELMR